MLQAHKVKVELSKYLWLNFKYLFYPYLKAKLPLAK